MNHKKIFLLAVAVGLLFLACSCPLTSAWRLILDEDRAFAVTAFNLLLDFVVGVFTVWGLYWAATEFAESAIKPDVRIRVGNPPRPPILEHPELVDYPLGESQPYQVVGTRILRESSVSDSSTPNVPCGIYLDNVTSRAGRHMLAVVRVCATPRPDSCVFRHMGYAVNEKEIWSSLDSERSCQVLRIQFAEELVVYQAPVLVGVLFILWPENLDKNELPNQVLLDYSIHTLDGANHEKTTLSVAEWPY
jgi:hypothetical protein